MDSGREKKILVTGASGFIGWAFLDGFTLLEVSSGYRVCACTRRSDVNLPSEVESVLVADVAQDTDWREALQGVDVVIHTAARVHLMGDRSTDPLADFRRVNVAGTLNLAKQAVSADVRRFIFISSIKVNGEISKPGAPFAADDVPKPVDPYSVSKYEAEKELWQLSLETGMEVIIIRPPLVYGPGVKANFLNMMRWLNKGLPLPLGAIRNKRSLVALDNLVDLIVTCIDHPAAANQTFLVSDGEDLSTTELLIRMGNALGKPARLLPIPAKILELGLSLLGKQAVAKRLCGSLQVDISKTRELLGWSPPVSVKEALRKTAEDFLKRNDR